MFGLLMDGFSTPEVTPAVATATKVMVSRVQADGLGKCRWRGFA